MSWNDWVIENTINKASKLEMIKMMIDDGISEDKAITLIANAKNLPGYEIAEKLSTEKNKLASIMANLKNLQNYTEIEKINMPSDEEFYERYWRANRPVVIKDLASSWPALNKWTFEYLKENFPDETIEVQTRRNSDKEFEINSIAHKEMMGLKEFIEKIDELSPTNDFYMTANNHVLENTKLSRLLVDTGKIPKFVKHITNNGLSHLWIGPAGTVTPLHHDENILFHTQIVGKKTWKFISPFETPNLYNHKAVFSPVDLENIDYEKYPKMRDVKIMEVTVEPGETVFLPLGWWHGVVSLEKSISLSFNDFIYPNNWVYKNPN